jgi:hypothetical protein
MSENYNNYTFNLEGDKEQKTKGNFLKTIENDLSLTLN